VTTEVLKVQRPTEAAQNAWQRIPTKGWRKGRVLNCLGSQIPRKAGDGTLYIFSRSQNLKRMHIYYYLPESNKVGFDQWPPWMI
jgi:hypothetical protein